MRSLLFIFILLVFIEAKARETIHLGLGETYRIPSQQLESLRVQKKGILQIKDEGKLIVVAGRKLGTTSLTLGKKQYHFQVLNKQKKDCLEQLKAWAEGKRGPELRVVNQFPEIHGRLLRRQDFQNLSQYTHADSLFRMAATIENDLQMEIEKDLESSLKANNLQSGVLVLAPYWRYLIAPSEKENLSLYKKILQPYGIEARIDSQAVVHSPPVEIKVFVAHVKKSFLRQWGLKWPGEVQAQLIPGGTLTWQSLQFSFKALEDQGEGRLLATPRLVTDVNNLAEFHSGGEIPIRSTTQFNNNVEWKSYGLFLKSKVTTNSRKNIKVEIDLEMSSLDQDNSTTDIPALTRSQVKTQVSMSQPQPILLSGFLQQQSGESRSGLPWLAQIPLFRPLFSSGQIYNRDYELVFILFPRILDGQSTDDH